MRKSTTITIFCIVLAIGLIGGALYVRGQRSKDAVYAKLPVASTQKTQTARPVRREFNTAELSKFDGKNGNKCYVAVDGTVYEIEQGRLWKDGQHETSRGQAMCGADLSAVIGKSPHGKSKLTTLEVVGTLKN